MFAFFLIRMSYRGMLSGRLLIGYKRVVFVLYGWECLVQHFLVQGSLMVWARDLCEIPRTCMVWQICRSLTAKNYCWEIVYFTLQFVSCSCVANMEYHMPWKTLQAAWFGKCRPCFIFDVLIILVSLHWIFVNLESCGENPLAFYINLLISVPFQDSAHLQMEDVVAQTGHIFAWQEWTTLVSFLRCGLNRIPLHWHLW